MQQLMNNRIGAYENISIKLLDFLMNNKEMDRKSYLKCKYGLEILLIDLSKLFVIYLFSFLLNTLLQTFIFHLFYMAVRLKGYGAHFKSSFLCTCVSSVLFVGVPFIITNVYKFQRTVLLLLFAAGFYILYRYASIGTAKNRIHKKKQSALKKKTLLIYLLCGITTLFIRSELYVNLIILGLFTACILTLPILTKSYKSEQFNSNEDLSMHKY